MAFEADIRAVVRQRRTAPAVRRRTLLAILALAGTLVLASACDPGSRRDRNNEDGGDDRQSTVAAGSSSHTITVDGQERTFLLYRPASLSLSDPVPLVVMLHGLFGSASQAESSYGWNDEADRGGFVVAYPDGIDRAWAVDSDCCGAAVRAGVDDVGFVTQVVDTIRGWLPVDPARVFVTGMSNGGMLAYQLVCRTTTFAAIGAVSTTMLDQCPAPKPISVIHIHGTADQAVPYSGGPGKGQNGGRGRSPIKFDGPPTPDLVATWRGVDQCPRPSTKAAGEVTTSVASCPDGRSVELITIAGSGHGWPGAEEPSALRARRASERNVSQAVNATDTIWRFFAAHPDPAEAGSRPG